MRREHFYRNKKALKRSAAGAVLALFLALQITGCSQTADQNKADRKTEQAQGTEKDGLGAEKSSAETEKNGTGTEKQEGAGNNESGPEKTREVGEAGEAGREPSPDGSQADAEAAADQGDGVIELIGKKTRVELNMEKATAADWSTVEKLAEMAGYFVLGNAGLGMMVNGELVVGGHVELDDIFHICTMAYKDGEGNTVTVSVPYIITAEGCRFDNDVEVAGVKFNGLEIDLSNGVTNREFVSNDADGAIRFFIMDLSPLNLTPEQVPTFVPNKYIASVDMLKNNNEYIITDMSDGLKAEWEALKEEYPNFVKFTLEMDRKSGYEGSFRVTAVNSADGKEKSHNYDFGTFTLLNNAINQVRFDNSKKSHSTSSGFTDKDLYDKDKNEHVGVIYDAFFSSKGFTVIRDTEEVFWIRSIADLNKWMRLEAD